MLNWIWHSVAAQIGIAGLAIAGLLAVAWFVPFLRRWAIGAAGLIFSAAAIYAKGASDANARRKAIEKQAEDAAIASGKAARTAADADAASGVRDGFNTDDK